MMPESVGLTLIRRILGLLGGEGFNARDLPLSLLIKAFAVQKILGINRGVPWPVHWSSKIKSVKNISRGTRYPGITPSCYIDGRNGIEIGENVWIGPGVSLISMNHDVCDYTEYLDAEPIRIHKDSWIGANAIVLPGVELGHHTVVAAGAVVTKSYPQGEQVIAGNPAKPVKNLKSYSG